MKMNVDAKQTSFYKIVCKDVLVKDLYVGSTKSIEFQRILHKSRTMNQANDQYDFKMYQTIRQMGGWSNWDLEIIEVFPYASLDERHVRERYWIQTLNASLSFQLPHVTLETIAHVPTQTNFLEWFAETFTVGKDLKCPKQKVDSATMRRTSFIDQLKRAGIEFSYASQERKTIDGIPYKGFYYGFELK